MNEDLQRALDMLHNLFGWMPPAVFVVVSLALLCLTLYAAYHALHSSRIVLAVANAPLADLRSTAAGPVKLRGTAQPPPAQAGKSPSSIVWYFRSSRSGSNSSTLATTGHFLVQDDYGVCAVDSGKADVVATTNESTHAFLDSSRTTVEKVIHAGDPVFAIGELRRGLPPLAHMPDVPCQLAKSGGVLLVSGSSERYVKVLYSLWFLVQAPLTLLFLGLLTFGGWTHIRHYPPGDGSAVTTFFDTLRTDPWQSDPIERQLRDQAAKQPDGTKP